MVYCDQCGVKADPNERYCRICGRSLRSAWEEVDLVYCNKCGAQASRRDVYCRLCGQVIDHPPFLWRIRPRPTAKKTEGATDLPSLELETRRLGSKAIENSSAIDTTTAANPVSGTLTRSEKTLARMERTKTEYISTDPASGMQGIIFGQKKLDNKSETLRIQPQRAHRRSSALPGYVMTPIGVLGLVSSVFYSSTILAFIGLGLTFWGVLLLFIRPQQYVRSDLMDSTALSSLKTIDRVISGLGYYEKGVYIPTGNSEKAIVFVPSEPFTRIPKPHEIGDSTFLENPKGMILIPPGLSLATLIAKGIGLDLEKLSLDDLRQRLPKILIENLEIVQDFEMNIDGSYVQFKFVDSIYAGFCSQLRGAARLSCSLGCPICSAMACILSMVTRKPISFEHDEFSPDGKTLESSYRILDWS